MEIDLLQAKVEKRPHSPLFARLAAELFDAGRTAEAEEVCRQGLAIYPSYSTGHLILAKCYAAAGRFDHALRSLKVVSRRLPDSTIIEELRILWRSQADAAGQRDEELDETAGVGEEDILPPVAASETALVPEALPREEMPQETEPVAAADDVWGITVPNPSEEPPAPSSEVAGDVPVEEATEHQATVIEERREGREVEDAAGEVREAKEAPSQAAEFPVPPVEVIPPAANVPPPPAPAEQQRANEHTAAAIPLIDDGRIVSKTLAEIYVKQGVYDEAIRMYRLLALRKPEQREAFEARITELEAKAPLKTSRASDEGE